MFCSAPSWWCWAYGNRGYAGSSKELTRSKSKLAGTDCEGVWNYTLSCETNNLCKTPNWSTGRLPAVHVCVCVFSWIWRTEKWDGVLEGLKTALCASSAGEDPKIREQHILSSWEQLGRRVPWRTGMSGVVHPPKRERGDRSIISPQHLGCSWGKLKSVELLKSASVTGNDQF